MQQAGLAGSPPTSSPSPISTADALQEICHLLPSGEARAAEMLLGAMFPKPSSSTKRASWSPRRLARIFVRDGFTDRYVGEPLVFPGALRALSVIAPSLFPYHPNWKQSCTHPLYWSHCATIDHVVPIARGGLDDESNIVTTSMLRNSAKSNWTVEELGWPMPQAPAVSGWDGLLPWFCREYERNEALRLEPPLQRWYDAARRAG
jgi:hypothetical protein